MAISMVSFRDISFIERDTLLPNLPIKFNTLPMSHVVAYFGMGGGASINSSAPNRSDPPFPYTTFTPRSHSGGTASQNVLPEFFPT